MMDRLKALAPWQIIALAVAVLAVFLTLAYLAVASLTTSKPPGDAKSDISADLNSEANQKIIKLLDSFEAPRNLPIQTTPLRTPDPNNPSTVNPFSG